MNVGIEARNGIIFIKTKIKIPFHFSERRLASSWIIFDAAWCIPKNKFRIWKFSKILRWILLTFINDVSKVIHEFV